MLENECHTVLRCLERDRAAQDFWVAVGRIRPGRDMKQEAVLSYTAVTNITLRIRYAPGTDDVAGRGQLHRTDK